MLLLLLACNDEPVAPEPLVLPADPAATGVPVGVRTETTDDGHDVEVWYPADPAPDAAGETVDLSSYVSDAVTAVLGPVGLPGLDTFAVRDAPVHLASEPYPVLIFSHGFGGFRTQSVDVVTHLASRGYVVIATDHRGRALPDLLPCLFSPALDGCTLSFEDPGPADVASLLAWLDDGPAWLADAVDPERLGLLGHSAGGGTTVTVANTDPRFLAVLPMAGGDAVTSGTLSLRLSGSCDAIVPEAGLAEAHAASVDETWVSIDRAGHLAFSDLCEVGFGALAETYLVARNDVSSLFLDQLTALGTDGCADGAPVVCEAYLPLETSDRIVRHYATVWFDRALYGRGPGAEAGVFAEATLAGP